MAGLYLALADQSISSNLPILYRVDQPNSNVVVFRGANVALAKAHGLIPSHGKNDGSDANGKDNAGKGDDGDGHDSNGNGNGYGSGYNGYNGNRYGYNGGYKPEPPKYTTTTTTTTTPYTTTTQYTTTTTTYKPPTIVYKPAPTYKPTYSQPKPYTPKYNVHEYAPVRNLNFKTF